MFFCGAACADAPLRTWTSVSGKRIEGRYVTLLMDSVKLVDADGREIKLPLDQLSRKDLDYVELQNPPELKVEYEESVPTREYVADSWTSSSGSYTAVNNPIYIIEGQFGARVKKTSSRDYNQQLRIMMMVFSVQNLDRDKYHLIARSQSAPFRLGKGRRNTFTYTDPKTYNIMFYNLSGKWPRGEKLGEYLILILDGRDEVIAHRSSGKWLYEYRDKLQKLKVGAWLDDKAEQVYPTTPIRSTME